MTILRDIPGYDGYLASPDGRIWSTKRKGRWRKQHQHNGYMTIGIWNGQQSICVMVHRMIALAWVPNPDNLPQVNYKNSDRSDNRFTNLEWVTNRGNWLHAYENGQVPLGSDRKTSKLTESDIPIIRQLLADGQTKAAIARRFSVSDGCIYRIQKGETWVHVTS